MVSLQIMEPDNKRQRTSKTNEKRSHFDELADIQDAQFEGDSLGAPAIRTALDQLIATQKLQSSTTELIQKALRQVKTSLDQLAKKPQPSTWTASDAKTTNLLGKVAPDIPLNSFFRSPRHDSLSVECDPPTNINVVGSFLLGYSSSPIADVAVEMPSSLFQDKDYINFKYHDKRLLYLIYLAHHFIETEADAWQNVSFTKYFLGGNISKPTLSISHKDFPQTTIRLIPTYASKIFDVKRLGDNRKNIRAAGSSSITKVKSEATVAYNHSILADATPIMNLSTLYAVSSSTPNFTDCVLLLEAWSTRYRFRQSKFIFAVLVADLINRSAVPQRASREQLLRCALNAIRSRTLNTLTLHNVKICASTPASLLHRMAESAAAALATIESDTAAEDPWNGVVPYLFTTARGAKVSPRPLSTLFDGFIRVQSKDKIGISFDVEEKLEHVLYTAFVDTGRISRIEQVDNGLYGLTFVSHEDVIRKVDILEKRSNLHEVKEFWGDKVSLRRFKDGKVAHSLVWDGGVRTLQEISTYIFEKHFGGKNGLIFNMFIGELEEAAHLSSTDVMTNQALSAFNELATLLRSIEGLPLRIHAVSTTSAHLRRCGLYEIRPNTANRFIEPLDIVASFESSSAWPNDMIALAASKAAFYVGLRTKLLEKGISSNATISFLEILIGGFVFRLRLKVDKERHILNGTEEGKNLSWETETLVQHHENVRRIGSTVMTQVCRLAKRWMNSQMLFGSLGKRRDSIVELLVTSIMSNSSMGATKSTMRGFFQFLHLLAEYPWEVCPLVVSFTSEEDSGDEEKNGDENSSRGAERCEAMTRAQKHFKRAGNEFGVYAAQGESVECWVAGGDALENVIIKRMQMTARASMAHMEQYLTEDNIFDEMSMRTLFTIDVDDFEAEIRMNEAACVMKAKSSEGYLKSGMGSTLLAGLDPIERAWERIEERIGKWAVVFGRVRSGANLYIVWRPLVDKPSKFALRECALSDLDSTQSSTPLSTSKQQMLSEVMSSSEGLVVQICTK